MDFFILLLDLALDDKTLHQNGDEILVAVTLDGWLKQRG